MSAGIKKGISDRISIFEQKAQSPGSGANTSFNSPGKLFAKSKNVHSLKSQFDTSSVSNSTSPPPPPPPRTLPPDSPPEVPKRTSVTSVSSARKPSSPSSSGKTSPVSSSGKISPISAKSSTSSRTSTPSSKTPSKAGSQVSNVKNVKKKVVSSPSPTTPISNNGRNVKKVAARTNSSPISNPVLVNSSGAEKAKSGSSKKISSSTAASATEAEINHKNNNINLIQKESIVESVPIIEVSLETPSATSTPQSNLNKKQSQPVLTEVVAVAEQKEADMAVVNKNFINATSGSNRYWSNQALQNDNSTKISQAMKLDLEYKEEKISSLSKEIDELSAGGASEEELTSLKRQKADLENRLKDQEEELDDLAGQVQMLEAAKTKLEMSMAAVKKEHRRELAGKEEELEDVRAAAQKKVKALEQQLENEHEERINFVREKHELETRIINLQEMASRSADEEQVSKLKKDLKRTKALLKDAQLMVEKTRNETSSKVVLRQLKNQLEDAEFAKTAAIKAKSNLELELSDLQQQLDDLSRSKSDVEDRLMRTSREKTDLSSQLEDNEEELHEVMKKYKASVAQLGVDQITIQEQTNRITDLEEEKTSLKSTVAELHTKIQSLEGEHILNPTQSRLELKVKELESKLELEQTTRGRMETQIGRLKEAIEKLNMDCESLRGKEGSAQENARKLQRQLRDLKEEYANLTQKEAEVNAKKNEFEKQLELAEAETVTAKNDLKLALKRIEDLQIAINGELDSESDMNSFCCSDGDSDTSEEGMESFLEHHRRACSVQRERESMARESMAREVIQREVRASIARESVARQLETMSEEPELKLERSS